MAASGEPIATSGTIEAWVDLNGYVARTQFVVCDALPCPILLGTHFIDQQAWKVMPMLQMVEMASGAMMRILRKRVPRIISQDNANRLRWENRNRMESGAKRNPWPTSYASRRQRSSQGEPEVQAELTAFDDDASECRP